MDTKCDSRVRILAWFKIVSAVPQLWSRIGGSTYLEAELADSLAVLA